MNLAQMARRKRLRKFATGGGGGGAIDISAMPTTPNFNTGSVNAYQSEMRGCALGDGGTKLFFSGSGGSTVTMAPLSTPFQIDTLDLPSSVNTGNLYSVGLGRGMWLDPNGNFFLFCSNAVVGRYDMSTQWDPSTSSLANSFNPSELGTVITQAFMNSAQDKLYIQDVNQILQYSLSTPGDVSTATYDSVALNVNVLYGGVGISNCFMGPNDKQLILVVANTSVDIVDLPTASDLTGGATGATAEFSSPTGLSVRGMWADTDRLIFCAGGSNDTVYQFNL